MNWFCSNCGDTDGKLGSLAWFTIWENKLVCLECWKALKFASENKSVNGMIGVV